MLTPEERALLTDVQDHLLELYVLKDQASNTKDWDRVHSLQADIAEAEAQRTEIRQLDTVRSASWTGTFNLFILPSSHWAALLLDALQPRLIQLELPFARLHKT